MCFVLPLLQWFLFSSWLIFFHPGLAYWSLSMCFFTLSLNHNQLYGFQVYPGIPSSVQFSSVAQSCPTLCDPVNHSTPVLPVYHQLPESTQTHVHQVGDAIQPSHPLSSPFPPALNLSQHQGLSNESALHIRWPKDWSFNFSISPFKEHPELISFWMDSWRRKWQPTPVFSPGKCHGQRSLMGRTPWGL